MNSFAEVPVVGTTMTQPENEDVALSITQKHNSGHGFAFGAPSTWIKRSYSDHMRRGPSSDVMDDMFGDEGRWHSIYAEPMKLDLAPDWSPENSNFLNGQRVDAFYGSIGIWSTKGLFSGSMLTPLCDPRQISIIFQCGRGVIQCPFGVLPFEPGDLVQIPGHCPFCVFVENGSTVRCICYYR